MKLQPTLFKESDGTRLTRLEAARSIRLLRLVGLKVKRYDRTDGRAYLVYSDSFSVTLILQKKS